MPKTKSSVREKLVKSGELFGGRVKGGQGLKEGQGIVTSRAKDVDTGDDVIVKAAAADSASDAALIRLEHEAQVLGDADSPRLSPLIDFAVAKDIVYLATTLIPGRTLAERLAERAPLETTDA